MFFTFRLITATPSKMTAVPIQLEPTMPNDWSSGNSDQPSSGAPNINKATPNLHRNLLPAGKDLPTDSGILFASVNR